MIIQNCFAIYKQSHFMTFYQTRNLCQRIDKNISSDFLTEKTKAQSKILWNGEEIESIIS